ncbi:hypothetical protein [Nocardiopsis sp. FIRDI 009]|uniref:hypothetical protein n=1 Tax=Nocardiopsis sp. FIRDI 009 TaxID=714197 RepID=UPI000E239D4B|nr:hypothetical protein [Nocardiopsis sp. FIRDI 009]
MRITKLALTLAAGAAVASLAASPAAADTDGTPGKGPLEITPIEQVREIVSDKAGFLPLPLQSETWEIG